MATAACGPAKRARQLRADARRRAAATCRALGPTAARDSASRRRAFVLAYPTPCSPARRNANGRIGRAGGLDDRQLLRCPRVGFSGWSEGCKREAAIEIDGAIRLSGLRARRSSAAGRSTASRRTARRCSGRRPLRAGRSRRGSSASWSSAAAARTSHGRSRSDACHRHRRRTKKAPSRQHGYLRWKSGEPMTSAGERRRRRALNPRYPSRWPPASMRRARR